MSLLLFVKCSKAVEGGLAVQRLPARGLARGAGPRAQLARPLAAHGRERRLCRAAAAAGGEASPPDHAAARRRAAQEQECVRAAARGAAPQGCRH
jgi:hypothetical protein